MDLKFVTYIFNLQRMFILLWCLFQISDLYSQKLHGTFNDSSLNGSTLILLEQKGNNFFFYDSVHINNSGDFSFGNSTYFIGYYRLVLDRQNWLDLILNPNESEVNIRFNDGLMNENYEVVTSNENKAMAQFGSKLTHLNQEIMNLVVSNSQLDFSDRKKAKDLEEAIGEMRQKKITLLNKISKTYPKTYFLRFSKVNGPADAPNQRSRKDSFFLSGFLSTSDFLRTSMIPSKLNEYLHYYTVMDESGIQSSIDDILLNAGSDPDVYEYCLEFLIDHFDSENNDDAFEYVLDEYVDDEYSAGEFSEYIQNRIEGFQALKVGQTTPDAVIENKMGLGISIASVAAMNKLTLLFFWSSSCPHCVKVLSPLTSLYSTFRKSGFEIVGISLDRNQDEWLSAIYNNDLNWVNLCDFNGWESPIIDLYYVSRTPTFLLLDDKMEIVGRPGHWKDIAVYLENWNP